MNWRYNRKVWEEKRKYVKDNIRTKQLLEKGYTIWRIWESEIKKMEIYNFKVNLDKIN